MKTVPTLVLVFALCLPGAAMAQTATLQNGETAWQAALRSEREAIAEGCSSGLSSLYKCPVALVMSKPFHLTVGSLPPGNGPGLGGAFVYHNVSEKRDASWSADAVISPNRSWRTGVYRKVVFTEVARPTIVMIGEQPTPTTGITIKTYPVLDFYAQGTSLGQIALFENQTTSPVAARTYAERQFIFGSRYIRPIDHLIARSSLSAETNVRMFSVSDPVTSSSPASARTSSSFLDLGLGYQFAPSLAGDRLRLKYSAEVREFAPLSNTGARFTRFTGELKHEWTIYGTRTSATENDAIATNDCANASGNDQCPRISVSRNQYGSIHLSAVGELSGRSTPFYLQPTLGGTDINGRRGLLAFADYRFRGTSTALVTGSIEHVIASIVGLSAIAEYGVVARPGESLRWSNRERSLGIGLSLRVGALPVAQLLLATGREGHRFIVQIEPSLLGGSKRPGLR